MSHTTVHCPVCFIEYTIPTALADTGYRLKNQKSIWCPNGHSWHYTGEREVDVERRKRQLAEQANARLAEEAAKHNRARLVAESMLRKHRLRAKAGLCPCCNRSFVNMQRHMKTQHPDYNVVPIKGASA